MISKKFLRGNYRGKKRLGKIVKHSTSQESRGLFKKQNTENDWSIRKEKKENHSILKRLTSIFKLRFRDTVKKINT